MGLRKEYLRYAQESVDAILPCITERTGVELEPVTVRDGKRFMPDARREFHESVDTGLLTGLVLRSITYTLSSAVAALHSVKERRAGSVLNATYRNNIIYLNLRSPMTQLIMDADEKQRQEYTNRILVHELTHHLWYGLEPTVSDTFAEARREQFWKEGYAMFGEQDWFVDINPPDHRIYRESLSNFPPLYLEGLAAVRDLVDQHGESILYELPQRWPEFEQQRNACNQ